MDEERLASFWTATELDQKEAYALTLNDRGNFSIDATYDKDRAVLSVRCVKGIEVENGL